jgi:predicted patatin/cPLA2 family phospholipase
MNAQVAENILRRRSEREGSANASSGLRTALVIQGGTLRSVASCGAAAALNYMGLTNAFDTVYGASSGAVNAAYFLSNQSALGITVYLDDVNNKRFINFLRVWKMMDLEFFFDEIVRKRKKHDLAALLRHPTELKVLTTCLEDERTVWFSSRDPKIDLYDVMKASCALPLIYGRGVRIGNKSYTDGVVTEPIPAITPLSGDYTDILVLMTRHMSYRETDRLGLATCLFLAPVIRWQLGPALYRSYRSRAKPYNRAAEIIAAGEHRRADGKIIRVGYICPDADAVPHRFEMGRDRLEAAAYSSWRNAFAFFGRTAGADRGAFAKAVSSRT